MAHPSLTDVLHFVRSLVGLPQADALGDAALLRRFDVHGDEAALISLIQRHGPLVLAVCRQVLADPHAAEDAFQATFLVLARKASAIHRQEALGAWLHRVAYRAAHKVKTAAARRQVHEKEAMPMPSRFDPADQTADWQPVLHEEIDRLPEKLRVPIVLCYLKGQSHEETAQELAWPLGTVKGRLSQARAVLQRRLTRRGVALSIAALAPLGSETLAAVPPALLAATAHAVQDFTAGSVLATPITAAAEGVLRTMFLAKLKIAVLVGLAVVVLVGGLALPMYDVWAGRAEVTPRRDEPVSHRSRPIDQRAALQALIDRGIQSAGGEAALRQLHLVMWDAKTQLADLEGPSFTVRGTMQGLDRLHVLAGLPFMGEKNLRVEVVVNAERTRVETRPGKRDALAQQLLEEKLDRSIKAAQLRCDLYAARMAQLLLPLRDKAVLLTPVGDITVAGRSASGVLVVQPGYPDLLLYFDRETGLPFKCAMPVMEDAEGPAILHELFFEDYRETAGVQHFTKLRVLKDGRPALEMEIVQTTILEEVNDDTFTVP